MMRLASTLRLDMLIQFRHVFYFVGGFFVLVWLWLFRLLPEDSGIDYTALLPGFMAVNLMITTFYFVAGLVLLEKGEGILSSLVVTPLRKSEYLISKAVSLTLLAILETALVVLVVYGPNFIAPSLLAGLLGVGLFYTFAGFTAVARYDAINEFLLPSAVFVSVLMLPLLDQFGFWESPLFYLHPMQPMLMLIRSGFVEIVPWQMAYGLLGTAVVVGASYVWAQRVFHEFVIRTAGA